MALCLAVAACNGSPSAPGPGSTPSPAVARRVLIVDAQAYHAGTLIAAMQAIESGVPVIVDSSGTPQGRAAVRQVQQLLLQGAAIDADAVEIGHTPAGRVELKPLPAGTSRATAPAGR